jgi:hypothetical protein
MAVLSVGPGGATSHCGYVSQLPILCNVGVWPRNSLGEPRAEPERMLDKVGLRALRSVSRRGGWRVIR